MHSSFGVVSFSFSLKSKPKIITRYANAWYAVTQPKKTKYISLVLICASIRNSAKQPSDCSAL